MECSRPQRRQLGILPAGAAAGPDAAHCIWHLPVAVELFGAPPADLGLKWLRLERPAGAAVRGSGSQDKIAICRHVLNATSPQLPAAGMRRPLLPAPAACSPSCRGAPAADEGDASTVLRCACRQQPSAHAASNHHHSLALQAFSTA